MYIKVCLGSKQTFFANIQFILLNYEEESVNLQRNKKQTEKRFHSYLMMIFELLLLFSRTENRQK